MINFTVVIKSILHLLDTNFRISRVLAAYLDESLEISGTQMLCKETAFGEIG